MNLFSVCNLFVFFLQFTGYFLQFYFEVYFTIVLAAKKSSETCSNNSKIFAICHWVSATPPWSATLLWWWGLCTDDPDDYL